jgi:hypothetical protein
MPSPWPRCAGTWGAREPELDGGSDRAMEWPVNDCPPFYGCDNCGVRMRPYEQGYCSTLCERSAALLRFVKPRGKNVTVGLDVMCSVRGCVTRRWNYRRCFRHLRASETGGIITDAHYQARKLYRRKRVAA